MRKLVLSAFILGYVFFPGSTLFAERLAKGASLAINKYGINKNIKNSCPSDIFVPTNTAAEWQAFVNHAPACVQVTNPIPKLCGGSTHTDADCRAIGGTPYPVTSEGCNICRVRVFKSITQGKYGDANWPPAGWGQYRRWSSNVATTYCGTETTLCTTRNHNYSGPGTGGCPMRSCSCATCCTAPGKSFSDAQIPYCLAQFGASPSCGPGACSTFYNQAVWDEIGCI